MENADMEKIARTFALVALPVVIVLAVLLFFGFLEMPGRDSAHPQAKAQTTPPPRRRHLLQADDSESAASWRDQTVGEGTFQKGGTPAPSPGETPQGSQ